MLMHEMSVPSKLHGVYFNAESYVRFGNVDLLLDGLLVAFGLADFLQWGECRARR